MTKINRDEKGRFLAIGNTWVVKNKIAYCFLNGELLFFTDAELYPSIKDYNFTHHANGYAATHVNGESIGAHRLINKPKPDQLVDHINRNKKDNRRKNLRNTTKSVNAYNCGLRSTNKSGVTGVYFRKDTKRWAAEIKNNYKKVCLGCFSNFEDAVKARKEAEAIYFGN